MCENCCDRCPCQFADCGRGTGGDNGSEKKVVLCAFVVLAVDVKDCVHVVVVEVLIVLVGLVVTVYVEDLVLVSLAVELVEFVSWWWQLL